MTLELIFAMVAAPIFFGIVLVVEGRQNNWWKYNWWKCRHDWGPITAMFQGNTRYYDIIHSWIWCHKCGIRADMVEDVKYIKYEHGWFWASEVNKYSTL